MARSRAVATVPPIRLISLCLVSDAVSKVGSRHTRRGMNVEVGGGRASLAGWLVVSSSEVV
jgi:hypothetical protein